MKRTKGIKEGVNDTGLAFGGGLKRVQDLHLGAILVVQQGTPQAGDQSARGGITGLQLTHHLSGGQCRQHLGFGAASCRAHLQHVLVLCLTEARSLDSQGGKAKGTDARGLDAANHWNLQEIVGAVLTVEAGGRAVHDQRITLVAKHVQSDRVQARFLGRSLRTDKGGGCGYVPSTSIGSTKLVLSPT